MFKKEWRAGRGSAANGGGWQSVGHLYGFGSTEEKIRVENMGCKPRGRACDGPFNHATGKGWVKGGVPWWSKDGPAYRDALSKGHVLKIALVESLGGISPHTRAHYRRHARRASAKGARDKTKYGTTRVSTRSFYTHHTQRLTTSAVRLDAKNIRSGVNRIKGVACTA